MQWKGKTVIPLKIDQATGQVTGDGAMRFPYKPPPSECTIDGNGALTLRITGSKDLLSLQLSVASGPVTASILVRCPDAEEIKLTQIVGPGGTVPAVVPLRSPKPVRIATPGGPGVFLQMQSCAPERSQSELLHVTTQPPLAQLGSTPPTVLETVTIDTVREQARQPRALGLTRPNFSPTETITDRTREVPGDGVCYWVRAGRVYLRAGGGLHSRSQLGSRQLRVHGHRRARENIGVP